MGLYVYGFVRADHPLPQDRRGIGAPPALPRLLRAVDGGGQGPDGPAAVVSDAPERLRARRRDLLAHHELLLALAEDGPVLPMRFGMVAPDEETVRERLAPAEAAGLSAALDRLAGRCEVNLKAAPATRNGLPALLRDEPGVRRLREEVRRRPGYEANVRLGEAVAKALRRRAAEAAGAALREVGPLAEDMTRGPETAECVLNASFLVPTERYEAFRSAVERCAAARHEQVELTLAGPLPCYSFVPEGAPQPGHAMAGA